MGWEKRGNNQYYYRKRREGEQVISEYVGSDQDQFTWAIATLDLAFDLEDQEHRRALQKTTRLDEQIKNLCDLLGKVTRGLLLAQGYHTHKGQWRKKRHA